MEKRTELYILTLSGEIQELSLELVSSFNTLLQGEHLPGAVARYILRRAYSYYEKGDDFGSELWNTIANFLGECHPFYRLLMVGDMNQKEDFCRNFCFEALSYLQSQPESIYYQKAVADMLAIYYDKDYKSHGYFDDYRRAHKIVETAMIMVTRKWHEKDALPLAVFLQVQQKFCMRYLTNDYDTYLSKCIDYYRYISDPNYNNRVKNRFRNYGCIEFSEVVLFQLMELAAQGYVLHQCYYCECYYVSERIVKSAADGSWTAKCPLCVKAGRDDNEVIKSILFSHDVRLYNDFQDFFLREFREIVIAENKDSLLKNLIHLLKFCDCPYIFGVRLLTYCKHEKNDHDLLAYCQENRKKANPIEAIWNSLELSPKIEERIEKEFIKYERFKRKTSGLSGVPACMERLIYKLHTPMRLLISLLKCRIRTLKEVTDNEHNP